MDTDPLLGPRPETTPADIDFIREVTTPGEHREYPVVIRPRGGKPINGRLIVMRLLPDQACGQSRNHFIAGEGRRDAAPQCRRVNVRNRGHSVKSERRKTSCRSRIIEAFFRGLLKGNVGRCGFIELYSHV